MALETRPFDAAEFLDSDETIAYFLEEALREGKPAEIARSFETAIRAKGGAAKLAKDSSLSLDELEHALAQGAAFSLADLMLLVRALGLHLTITFPHGTSDPNGAVDQRVAA